MKRGLTFVFLSCLFLTSCSSVGKRQGEAQTLLDNVVQTASGVFFGITGKVTETVRNGKDLIGTLQDTVEGVQETIRDVRNRVEKVQEGITRLREAKELIEEGVSGGEEEE